MLRCCVHCSLTPASRQDEAGRDLTRSEIPEQQSPSTCRAQGKTRSCTQRDAPGGRVLCTVWERGHNQLLSLLAASVLPILFGPPSPNSRQSSSSTAAPTLSPIPRAVPVSAGHLADQGSTPGACGWIEGPRDPADPNPWCFTNRVLRPEMYHFYPPPGQNECGE